MNSFAKIVAGIAALLAAAAIVRKRAPGSSPAGTNAGRGGKGDPLLAASPGNGFSTLAARQVTPTQTTQIRYRKPWGVMLHTSGRGVTVKAKTIGAPVMDVALRAYLASQNGSNGYLWGGPSYVIGWDGAIVQIADDTIRTFHGGGAHRADYLSGKWEAMATPEMVAQWKKQWQPPAPDTDRGFENPAALFPSVDPNVDYVGVEMIPVGTAADGWGGRLLFTEAQHDAAAKLCADIARRHELPKGWALTSRLLGHEDVQPLDREDAGGGWDPGWLRAAPYFDFGYVRQYADRLGRGGGELVT